MPRTTVFGWYDGNIFGAVERVERSCARCPRPMSRGSAIGGSSPSARSWRPAPKSGRSSSAAMTCRASCSASAMRTYANRYAAAAGQIGRRSSPTTIPAIARRAISSAKGVHVEVIIDSAQGRAPADAGQCPGAQRRPSSSMSTAGKRRDRRRARRPHDSIACDFAGDVGRLEPGRQSRLPQGRQAACGTTSSQAFLPPMPARPSPPRARRAGAHAALGMPCRRRRARRRGRERPGLSSRSRWQCRSAADEAYQHHAAVVGQGDPPARPSSTTRTT